MMDEIEETMSALSTTLIVIGFVLVVISGVGALAVVWWMS